MLRIIAAAGALSLLAAAAPRLPGAQGAVTGFVAVERGGGATLVGRGGRVWRVDDGAALARWAGRAVSLAGRLKGRRFLSVESVVAVGMAPRAARAFLRRPRPRRGFLRPLRTALLPLRLLVRTGAVAARACRAAGRLARGSRSGRRANNYPAH
ncbi:MAG: hypothetical protein OXN97_06045 [Bryobacterales bacterium]|nr:hypothetical protein [Bryobacterales bacterium]